MAEKKIVKKAAAKPAAAKKAAKPAAPKTVPAVAKQPVIRKKFSGTVVSTKSDKTAVVKVEVVKVHPKYGKRYTQSQKYKVHDEKNEARVGEKVYFVECRPLSRDKRWRLVK